MGCARVGDAIVCSRGRGILACVGCGQLATRLCDFKLSISRTCDAAICTRCTTRLPGDKDACPRHANACLEACRLRGLAVPA